MCDFFIYKSHLWQTNIDCVRQKDKRSLNADLSDILWANRLTGGYGTPNWPPCSRARKQMTSSPSKCIRDCFGFTIKRKSKQTNKQTSIKELKQNLNNNENNEDNNNKVKNVIYACTDGFWFWYLSGADGLKYCYLQNSSSTQVSQGRWPMNRQTSPVDMEVKVACFHPGTFWQIQLEQKPWIIYYAVNRISGYGGSLCHLALVH